MSLLFQPLKIKNLELKNRLVVSPMCQYSSRDGFASDWHLVHLGSRAVGGAGLVFTEAAAVSPEGRISVGDLGIWKDEHIPMMQRIVDFIHGQGASAGIQLAHAGRKASFRIPWEGDGSQLKRENGGWNTLAPSEIPFEASDTVPTALDDTGIRKVLADFRAAAQRAKAAGFRVVEVHAAHGYLLHQFLSPLSNRRVDGYGGSFDHRIRLVREVVAAVREVWPAENALFVRISATDWVEGGWSLDDSIRLAGILKDEGVDLIDVSSGGSTPDAKIPAGPNYQVPFSEAIRQKAGIMTGAVGLITRARQAEEILTGASADLIFIAREFLRNPYFPRHAAFELEEKQDWPEQYGRAEIRKRK